MADTVIVTPENEERRPLTPEEEKQRQKDADEALTRKQAEADAETQRQQAWRDAITNATTIAALKDALLGNTGPGAQPRRTQP